LVLEDLEASGCRFPGPDDEDAAARARRVVAGHARIHATLWESERFEKDLSWVEPPMRHEFGAALSAREPRQTRPGYGLPSIPESISRSRSSR